MTHTTHQKLPAALERQARRKLKKLGYRSTARGYVLLAKVDEARRLELLEVWSEQEAETEKDAAELAGAF